MKSSGEDSDCDDLQDQSNGEYTRPDLLSYDVLFKLWNIMPSLKDRSNFASACSIWRNLLRASKWPPIRVIRFEKFSVFIDFALPDAYSTVIRMPKNTNIVSRDNLEQMSAQDCEDAAALAVKAFFSRIPSRPFEAVELINSSKFVKLAFRRPLTNPWSTERLLINDIELLHDFVPSFINPGSVTVLQVRDPRSRLIISEPKFSRLVTALSRFRYLKVLDVTLNEIYRGSTSCCREFEPNRLFVESSTCLEEIRIYFGKAEHRLIGSPPFCDFARLRDLWSDTVRKIYVIDSDKNTETDPDIMNACYLHSVKVMELLEREFLCVRPTRMAAMDIKFYLRTCYWPYPSGPMQKNGYVIHVITI